MQICKARFRFDGMLKKKKDPQELQSSQSGHIFQP